MLCNLQVQNFRSIRKAEIEFSKSGLTVVVGANGSGKSNLIKCLEFLSSLARIGLERALLSRQGLEGLVPKAIPANEIENTELVLDYSVMLPSFAAYPADGPALRVDHRLVLGFKSREFPTIVEESLKFFEPLIVQQFLTKTSDEKPTFPPGSWIRISRKAGSQVVIDSSPSVNAENVDAYLRWFSLASLNEHFQGEAASTLFGFLADFLSVGDQPRPRGEEVDSVVRPIVTSLLEGRSPILIAPEIDQFRSILASIRRYDLQLVELRREQRPNPRRILTQDGRGMPSAVRTLRDKRTETAESWQRITNTLGILAPHIIETGVRSLTPEKEFVEFLETLGGRSVESWESSDGTLRALATLVALETHPAGGTILIEEPEQGLHPWAITVVMEHMREVITKRRIQVIVTTHSQQVLDCIQPEELLVATRSEASGTMFRSLSQILPAANQAEAGLIGQLWVDGLLGGVPGPSDGS